jgi:cbb3-type cytochrome oxidase maturation protein
MNIIYLLLPLALLLALLFVALFIWANKHDQFRDLDSAGKRILIDDISTSNKEVNPSSKKK